MSIMDKFKPDTEPPDIDTEPHSNKRVQGRITVVNEEGWGFIISKEIPFRRIFFHWTALENDTLTFDKIEEGMIVEFKPIQVPEKGWRAIKIKVISE